MRRTYQDYLSLTHDVLKLYGNIKHSSLEDLFIKLANIDVGVFSSWLLRNPNIKKTLRDRNVYKALEFLCEVRSVYSYGEELDISSMNKVLFGSPLLLIFFGFKKIIDLPSVKEILQPFSDIVQRIVTQYSIGDSIKTEGIEQDIITIKNAFLSRELQEEGGGKKGTVSQQKIRMFQSLLTKFVEITAAAAEAMNMQDLSSAIRSGALTNHYKYEVLEKYFSTIDYSRKSSDADFVENLAKDIFSDKYQKRYESKWTNYNYSYIEMALMQRAGQISQEEKRELAMQFIEKQNEINQSDETTIYPGIDTSKFISLDYHLNPKYLLLLRAFLIYLKHIAGLPTGMEYFYR
jgi:hypothetical protein